MTWDVVQQLLRILLQLTAGWLLSLGYISEEMATTFVGSMISLGGIVWWIVWQRNRPAAP